MSGLQKAYRFNTTVKREKKENTTFELIDSTHNRPVDIKSGGYDLIINIKRESSFEAEESNSEEANEVKCEYLEYGDETSDNESNTSRHSIDLVQQDNAFDEKSEFKVNEKRNECDKHEDLFLIVVSDKTKDNNKNLPKTKAEKKKNERKCDLCNKWYNTSYFSEHMKRLHGDKKRKAEAARISAIKRKLKSKKVSCEICQKIVSKVNYKAHFATHDPNKSKYICDQCGKTFAQKRLLVVHKVSHNTEFNFECKLCPYKGRSSGVLRMHMIKHKGDYKYVCTECPAKFLNKSNLNKHFRIHTHKEPMFTCDTCQLGFQLKLTLERHIEVKHLGIRKFVCDTCGKTFGYRKGLLQHQVHVHKREKNPHGRTPSYLETKS